MLTATLLLALTAPRAAPRPSFPGGLLSPTGRTAYLGTRGGVVALDLTTGEDLWRSAASQRPLFVLGDRLYALALSEQNEVRVHGHDLGQRGERVFRSAPVALPRWARSAPAEGHDFICTFRREGRELRLDWQASARPARGPAKEARGAARIDLRTGHVKVEKAAAEPAPASLPRLLEKRAVRWHRTLAGHLHALVVEEVAGSTPRDRKYRLVLCGWEERTGKATLSRELLRGRDPVLLIDAGGGHLWLREGTAAPGADVAAPTWSVFSAVDGRLVTRIPVLPGTREAILLGNRAFCLTVRSRPVPGRGAQARHEIHAVDVESGKVLWKRELGEGREPR